MNQQLLRKHIAAFAERVRSDPEGYAKDRAERADMVIHYRSFTSERIGSMTEEDVFEYLSPLWAMLMWGNKNYVIDKILSENGLDRFRENLSDLLWSTAPICGRWDAFRKNLKGIGPAMTSEILGKTHPDKFTLWNRRAYVGLNYLEVEDLPRHNYQVTGKVYERLCVVVKQMADQMSEAGFEDATLLAVDYFIWSELQYPEKPPVTPPAKVPPPASTELEFVHDEVRDKLRDIGQWLGFDSQTEKKVSEGARVDTVWEATIGNMGRVIYVFEVQTKGNIDSLILNLLKSLANPAVQGVVAVSDKEQLETIRRRTADVKELRDDLHRWDYEEVLRIHESLEFVNTAINELGLVPRGF